MNKSNIHRTIMYLKKREYINSNYIKLTFTGTDIEPFSKCTVGANNKIFIPPKGVEEVIFPNNNLKDELEETIAIRRTYTHAGMDLRKKEMYVEFVAHGVEGPASDYAINAPIGAPIGLAMKIKETELAPDVNSYYIIGDATAIPVIKAILKSLKADVNGEVFIEVSSQEDYQSLNKPEGINIHWIVNNKTAEDTVLADKAITYLEAIGTDVTTRFAFIACEFSNVRKLRNYFRKVKNWEREEVSAYSYWKYGVAETKSEKERREEKNRL